MPDQVGFENTLEISSIVALLMESGNSFDSFVLEIANELSRIFFLLLFGI